MQPLGCFGSSLAYSDKSSACKACPARNDCAAKVTARFPILMKLLERFYDGTGHTMAKAWRNALPKPPAPKRGVGRPPAPTPDPTTPIDALAAANPSMGAVVSMLKKRPHTVAELSMGLVQSCSYSASYARRIAFDHVSTLTACERVERTGPIVELK